MTYNASIPLNSDSPSIFPGQSQANFTRLLTIISADHQFNLTAAANDGYHNLIHMIPQAPSGALAGTGRFYVKSTSGLIQAFYMDDAGTEYQITPSANVGTQNIHGTAFVASGGTTTALNVAYDYTGVGTVYVNGTPVQRSYTFLRSGAQTNIEEISDQTGVVSRPELFFVGTVLTAINNDAAGQNIVWSLMVNKIF